MRPMPSLPALLTAALLLGVLGGPARALPPERDAWIELRTPSFVLFSDAGEKNARQVAESLERLRSVLGQLNPGLKLTAPNPAFVFVFRNSDAFKPYRRIYNGRPVDAGGYFITRPEANWVAVNGDPRTDEVAILNHEYLHYILRNNYPSLPLWFNEGMAEVYSSFRATAREAQIGIPVPEHVYWLRRHALIPPARLFAIDQTSPDYNEGDRRGVFYAESWALVHLLLVGSPEHQQKAARYLQEMAREQPAPDAFRTAFGIDDATLEEEIRTYVRKHLFDVRTVPVQPNEALQVTRRDLPRAEALARLGGLLVSLDPSLRPAAAEHFQAALALDPAQPQALAGKGWLESLAGRPQEARPWLERAAGKAPDDFVIQYLYGLALLEGKPGPADLREARRAFAQAVALQPDFGEAWARLAFAQAQENPLDGPLPLEAVRSFETAHRLLPSRTDVAFNLTLAYARSGQRDRAREIIDHVLAVHGTPDEVQRARAALIQEQRRDVEDLIEKSDLEHAAALLEQLAAQSPDPGQKAALLSRLDDVRHVLAYNRFVGRYNKAMELAGRDPKAAIAILEDLVATTSEPGQLEQAKRVLESLKAERR